jgi:RNA polymerase sigma-70 factor (ECF subfamily)
VGEVISGQSDLDRARDGDDAAFTRLVEPLRHDLHAHCYRMLGSTHDADDALQDALLRAWRGLAGFEGRSSLRSWLYTVATRTCLDLVDSRGKRAMPVDLGPSSDRAVLDQTPLSEVAWLGPYPDGPDALYERRESIELAFVAALQHIPGNQRAALLLFEVLGFSVAEIATMMDTSTTSVNSALARARKIVAEKVPASTPQSNADVREIAGKYAAALQRGDADALVALLTEDVTWSMPPLPHWYEGIDAVMDFTVEVPIKRCPSWRYLLTSANSQPAVAFYVGAEESGPHFAFSITVLSLRGSQIAGITSFLDADFAVFGLPASV